jgi:hypothetical protein
MIPPRDPYQSKKGFRVQIGSKGGAVFQPAGILEYVEDLKHGPNADIEPEETFLS